MIITLRMSRSPARRYWRFLPNDRELLTRFARAQIIFKDKYRRSHKIAYRANLQTRAIVIECVFMIYSYE